MEGAMALYACMIQEGQAADQKQDALGEGLRRLGQKTFGDDPAATEIRWGRTDEQKAQVVSELTQAVASTLDVEKHAVGVVTVDVPSKWNMEGGELLPEPGEEAEWLARHHP
jgi:phenylpyruvate tautomerase PptA (4-oxalocrotonate tautomerase family)